MQLNFVMYQVYDTCEQFHNATCALDAVLSHMTDCSQHPKSVCSSGGYVQGVIVVIKGRHE